MEDECAFHSFPKLLLLQKSLIGMCVSQYVCVCVYVCVCESKRERERECVRVCNNACAFHSFPKLLLLQKSLIGGGKSAIMAPGPSDKGVLQCVAVCCSVLQCLAVFCSVAVCCSTCHIDVRDSFFTLINEGHLIQSRVYDLVVVD